MLIFFDTEVEKSIEDAGGWQAARSGAAGLSAAVTLSEPGMVRIYDRATLDKLVIALEEAGSTLVTFNGKNFDLPLISSLFGRPIHPSIHIDLLEVVSEGDGLKGWGLDDVCKRTIGRGKTGHGAYAPTLYRLGRYAELFDYCLQDVYLTRDLFHHIQKRGIVIAPDGRSKAVHLGHETINSSQT